MSTSAIVVTAAAAAAATAAAAAGLYARRLGETEGCSTHDLLSTSGRWMRIQNATATPPLVYRMKHKANAGMRIHDQRRKLNSSLQPWPEYLMWQWHTLKGCELPIATHDELCQALEALQLSRIFIVGDSMQWSMAQSLWKVLSKQPGDPTRVHSKHNGKMIRSKVMCGTGSNARYVLFQFVLNNRLTNCTRSSWEGPFEFLPWVRDYVSDATPTLLLVHMGAHLRSVAAFEEAMASFMRSMTLRSSSSLDRVILRTATPGQVSCDDYSRPFAEPADFELRKGGISNISFHWDLHPLFNSIAAREIARAAGGGLRDRIALLDVYQMTTMRPDGRRGGEDCLHFFLPGVPDWWTHKMLVQLRHWAARVHRQSQFSDFHQTR